MQLRRNLTVLTLLAAILRPAVAATPLQSARLVPDITVNLDGTLVLAGRVAEDDLNGNVSVVAINGLADGEHIDAYHVLPNGDQLMSFDISVNLPGDITARPADVVRLSGTTFTREVNANDLAIPEGVNTDAVGVENGNLLLSFDTTVLLGEMTVNKADVVSFNGSTPSLRFDASAAGIAAGLDVDAVDSVAGHLLLSFDGSGSVGGVSFDDEDVLEYDGSTWQLLYDGSNRHSALEDANLIAFAGEVLPPTATPTDTPSTTPTDTPTLEPTDTPSATPVPTDLPTLTPTTTNAPSDTPTDTPEPTLSPTETRVPSTTPTETPTETPVPSTTPTGTLPPSATATVTATATLAPTQSPTASPSAILSATSTPTASITPTVTLPAPSATASPTATAVISSCSGDCNGDNEVTVDELVLLVNIALELQPTSACLAGDSNHDGMITIDEILIAVNHTLTGC